MTIVILEKLHKFTKSILGKKTQNNNISQVGPKYVPAGKHCVNYTHKKTKTSDRGLVLLGTAINM